MLGDMAPAQTVQVKKKSPQDRKPKAAPKPAPLTPENGIDLGVDDTGPQTFPVHFLRDDEVWYDAHLPKGTLALALGEEMKQIDMTDISAMREAVDKFIRLLFASEDVEAIGKRLDDPDDRLDLVHLRMLINKIAERTGGLPTT